MTEKKVDKEKPKCFVIMPIADTHGYEGGHFSRVYEHLLKPAIIQAGYHPVRADDTVKTDYIVIGIIQMIVDSDIVICDLSARNPNVMYELGIRHAFNKPVTLIKDKKTDKVFDIQGLRYIEYDESLRIDTVQKDISKISVSLQETAKLDGKVINSVVQLAGIKAANVPDKQTVSGDTQLILSAIGSLESRINNVERKSRSIPKHFFIKDDCVYFSEHDRAKVGEEIYDGNANPLGVLVAVLPEEEGFLIRQKNGDVVQYHSNSARAKGMTSLPF
ncbi:hypothetical protein [Aeromonas sp. AE23HZ002T15]